MAKGLKQLDPVQGLVDYTLDVKPYHTKIIEVLIEYVYGEALDVTILDKTEIGVNFLSTVDLSTEDFCEEGYGTVPYGSPGIIPIASPNPSQTIATFPAINQTTNSITLLGNVSADFRPGEVIALVDVIQDFSNTHSILSHSGSAFVVPGDQTTQFTPSHVFFLFGNSVQNKQFTTTSSSYDLLSDRTTILVQQIIPNTVLSGHIGMTAAPGPNTGSYTVQTVNVDGGSIGQLPDANDPFSFIPGNNEHTIISFVESLSAAPAGEYSAFVTPSNIVIQSIGALSITVNGNVTARFHQGHTFSVVGGTIDGTYTSHQSVFDGTNTTITVLEPVIDNGSGNYGMITPFTLGYDEHTKLCSIVPETLVRAYVHDSVQFEGLGFDVHDDVIAYNLENNDSWGYDLPLLSIVSNTQPTILSVQPGTPSQDDVWFDSISGTMFQYSGTRWLTITTAWWADTSTGGFFYRTKNKFVDTGWVLDAAKIPGYADIFPADAALGTNAHVLGYSTEDLSTNSPLHIETSLTYRDALAAVSGDVVSIDNELLTTPSGSQLNDMVAASTIDETLNFGWGFDQVWSIASTNQPNSSIDLDGDFTFILLTDEKFNILGSDGNDGEYNVVTVSYSLSTNTSTIVVTPPLPNSPSVGLDGSVRSADVDITEWFQYNILLADSGSNEILVRGDATSSVQINQQIKLMGTTSNNGPVVVTTVPVYDGINTLFEVTSITTTENGGWIESYKDFGIRLTFRDTVSSSMVEHSDAAILTDAGVMVGAWDYNHFDIGTLDETLGTVIHLYGSAP